MMSLAMAGAALATGLTGLGAGAGYGAWFTRRVERRWPAIGRRVSTTAGDMHVIERGRPDGPPVILVHGAASNARDPLWALEQTFDGAARLLSVDRPGFGYTPSFQRPDRLAGHAEALAAFIEAEGLRAPVVVGHSYGGSVALRLAMDFPNAAGGLVVLGAPSHGFVGPVARYHAWTRAPLTGWVMSNIAAPIVGSLRLAPSVRGAFAPQPAPAGYVQAVGPHLVLRPWSFAANSADLHSVNPELAAQEPRYPGITIPVAIIAGEVDDSVSTERHSVRLAAALPDSRLALLPGVGHMPHYERAQLVVEHALALAAR